MVKFDEEKQKLKLKQLRSQEAEELARILSDKYGLQYVDLTTTPISTDALRLIPEDRAREIKVAAFNLVGKTVHIAVLSPNKDGLEEVLDAVKEKGYTPKLYMASEQSLEFAWGRYQDITATSQTKRGALDIASEEVQESIKTLKTLDDVRAFITGVLEGAEEHRTSRVLEAFLAGALALDASDLHIEPEDEMVRLRYRLDGLLTDVLTFKRNIYTLILSRVKLLSGLKINIKKEAQDGRFSITVNDAEIEIRTSVIPSEYGESIVLRVLNPDTNLLEFDSLGVGSDLAAVLNRELEQPNGMILTTGPTGSGKTTMLYALLKKIYNPDVKVITIEDPIEYHFEGIVQTQADEKKGYGFAQGLRSILRQDPDVILVGEIRDSDTAETAVHAALTGHLVFTTLHTNNAAGAFPRLINLGVDPKILGAAVRLAMAQRLVRKLCDACKKEVPLEGEEKKYVEEILSAVPENTPRSIPQNPTTHWEAVGCEKCSDTGYQGRVGIYEAIRMDDAVEQVVRTSPSEKDVLEASNHQSILSMEQDGVLKALEGVTSLSELERVVGKEV